jgi:ATP-binding cassette, subfamily C (CFTR/MRP), member 1
LRLQVGGQVAYVPQTAWIMNETLRENILMGQPLDERRYVPFSPFCM